MIRIACRLSRLIYGTSWLRWLGHGTRWLGLRVRFRVGRLWLGLRLRFRARRLWLGLRFRVGRLWLGLRLWAFRDWLRFLILRSALRVQLG